jgi:hypothetical protein
MVSFPRLPRRKLKITKGVAFERVGFFYSDDAALEDEHELFECYDDVARDLAAANGTITVLVAHRFSQYR